MKKKSLTEKLIELNMKYLQKEKPLPSEGLDAITSAFISILVNALTLLVENPYEHVASNLRRIADDLEAQGAVSQLMRDANQNES